MNFSSPVCPSPQMLIQPRALRPQSRASKQTGRWQENYDMNRRQLVPLCPQSYCPYLQSLSLLTSFSPHQPPAMLITCISWGWVVCQLFFTIMKPWGRNCEERSLLSSQFKGIAGHQLGSGEGLNVKSRVHVGGRVTKWGRKHILQ
jgi:hypothetical protein